MKHLINALFASLFLMMIPYGLGAGDELLTFLFILSVLVLVPVSVFKCPEGTTW